MPIGSIADVFVRFRADASGLKGDVDKVKGEARRAGEDAAKTFGAGFKRGTGQAGEALEHLGERAGRLTGVLQSPFALGAAAATAFGLAIAESTREAIRLQRELTSTRVFFPGGPASIAAIEKELLGLDARLGSSTDLVQTFRKALLDSADPKVALEMTKVAAGFAKVAGVAPTEAVGLLGDLMDSFGIKAERASHITDVLFFTMKNGGGSVQELAANFPRLADTAIEAGVGMEELSAALVTLGQVAGASPQKNIIALNTALNALILNRAKFRERGVDVDDLVAREGALVGILQSIKRFATDAETGLLSKERLREIGISGRNLSAVLKLIADDSAKVAENLTKLKLEAPGSSAEAFQKALGSVGAQLDRLIVQFDKMAEAIGRRMLPALESALKTVADLVDRANLRREEVPPQEQERRRRDQRLRALDERSAGAGIDSGIPPLPEGGRITLEEKSQAQKDAERALAAAIRERRTQALAGGFEAAGRQSQREREAVRQAIDARRVLLDIDRELEDARAKHEGRAIEGAERVYAERVRLAHQGATEEKRALDATTQAVLGATRARIKGIDVEIEELAKLIGLNEPGREQNLGKIAGLSKERDTLLRQITDAERGAAAERKSIETKLGSELATLAKDRTKAIQDEIKLQQEQADRRFKAEVALGRRSVEEERVRLAEITADESRSVDERVNAVVELFNLEKRLAEDRLDFRKSLNLAALQDELEFWASAARAAEQGSQAQMDAIKRVTSLVRQQRDEARGAAQEALSIARARREERENPSVNARFTSLATIERENRKQREEDQTTLERARGGGRVREDKLEGALRRQSTFEGIDRAGGPEAAFRAGTKSLPQLFMEQMVKVPDVVNTEMGKVVEGFRGAFTSIRSMLDATFGQLTGRQTAAPSQEELQTRRVEQASALGGGTRDLQQRALAMGDVDLARELAAQDTAAATRKVGLLDMMTGGGEGPGSTIDLISRQAREARSSGLFGPEHLGPFRQPIAPVFGGIGRPEMPELPPMNLMGPMQDLSGPAAVGAGRWVDGMLSGLDQVDAKIRALGHTLEDVFTSDNAPWVRSLADRVEEILAEQLEQNR
jgi:TP901 family phage tail tape measure protein